MRSRSHWRDNGRTRSRLALAAHLLSSQATFGICCCGELPAGDSPSLSARAMPTLPVHRCCSHDCTKPLPCCQQPLDAYNTRQSRTKNKEQRTKEPTYDGSSHRAEQRTKNKEQ